MGRMVSLSVFVDLVGGWEVMLSVIPSGGRLMEVQGKGDI